MAMKVFWGWRCCVCRFIFGIESGIVFTVHLEICRTSLLNDWSWQVSLVLYFFGVVFFYLLLSCISISVCLTVHLVEKLASDWRFQVGAFLRAANWWKPSWGKLMMGGDICLGSLQPLRGWRAFILASCTSSSSSSPTSPSSSHHYHLCHHGGH